jgi:cytochrome P450
MQLAGGRDLDECLAHVLVTPEGRSDPYPAFAQMQGGGPAFYSELAGGLVVTGYSLCSQLLRDPRLARHVVGAQGYRRWREWALCGLDPTDERRISDAMFDRLSILVLNPPDHTRLRRLVSRAFTPRSVENLRPAIERRCASLIEDMATHGTDGTTVDVMESLAFPLSVGVIADMFAVPENELPRFRSLMRRSAQVFEYVPLEVLDDALTARIEFDEFFVDLVAERRARPRDDLLSGLIAARDGDDRLSEREMVDIAVTIFGAGFETTTNLIGNGLLALIRNPAESQRLRRQQGEQVAMAAAIEEMLRYDSPVQITVRYTTEEMELFDTPIAAGTFVLFLVGAANRDPARFDHPDAFIIDRHDGPPLSFGGGIHHCVGAALARAEAQVAFSSLLERFEGIDADLGGLQYNESAALRGLSSLPVLLTERT